MPTQKPRFNIADVVNGILIDVGEVLAERKEDRYFEEIVLIYSTIENVLKWLIFLKVMWGRHAPQFSEPAVESNRKFCRQLSFNDAERLALMLGIIDYDFYKRVDAARNERNDIIHQFWRDAHRGNNLQLRRKLEELDSIFGDLILSMNVLLNEIGNEEVLYIRL